MVIVPTSGIHRIYTPVEGKKARVGQFMSGSGTNVVEVLKLEERLGLKSPFKTIVIVTDDPDCNAEAIGKEWGKEVVSLNIKGHYRQAGLRNVSIKTEEGQKARATYTEQLWDLLEHLELDIGVFGGFEPLTNLVAYLPCLNVHPGDLTYLKNGERHLVGLHTEPIQRALEEQIGFVRSTVILATPYKGAGENMDDGPIIGLGPKLVYGDETDAKTIQNMLKEVSDWKVLPRAVEEVARGNVIVDFDTNQVYTGNGVAGFVMRNQSEFMDK